MKKFKTLLIGLGGIGFFYDRKIKNSFISHSKALKKSKLTKLLCAVDQNNAKILNFKKTYGLDATNDLNDAIKKHKPEFIVISVNTSSLYDVLTSVSKFKNIRYVLVEKPGTNDSAQLKKIISIYKKKKIKLFINYNRSYQKNFINHFSIYKKKSYFKSIYIYNRGFLNNCSHFLNLIFMFLSLPKKIFILKKGNSFKSDIQPDIKLTFKNGEILFIANENRKIVHNEYLFFNNKYKVNSDKNFTELNKFVLKKNHFIKNASNFVFSEFTKINKKNYQTNVYEKIFKDKNKFFENNINRSAIKVLYLYEKIMKIYNKLK